MGRSGGDGEAPLWGALSLVLTWRPCVCSPSAKVTDLRGQVGHAECPARGRRRPWANTRPVGGTRTSPKHTHSLVFTHWTSLSSLLSILEAELEASLRTLPGGAGGGWGPENIPRGSGSLRAGGGRVPNVPILESQPHRSHVNNENLFFSPLSSAVLTQEKVLSGC